MSTVLPLPRTTEPAPRTAGRGPLAGFGKRHVFLVLLFAVLTPLTFALFGAAFGEKMMLDRRVPRHRYRRPVQRDRRRQPVAS
jgi:hypothetical protein